MERREIEVFLLDQGLSLRNLPFHVLLIAFESQILVNTVLLLRWRRPVLR